ncbi:hypothetical protein [Elizabethkingia ursingii]
MKFNYVKYGAYLALVLGLLCLCVLVFEKGEQLGMAIAQHH